MTIDLNPKNPGRGSIRPGQTQSRYIRLRDVFLTQYLFSKTFRIKFKTTILTLALRKILA